MAYETINVKSNYTGKRNSVDKTISKGDRLILRKGTIIHVAGIPYELAQDTIVLGSLAVIPSPKAIGGVIKDIIIEPCPEGKCGVREAKAEGGERE